MFRRKFYYLTVPESSVGEPFSVSLISAIETFYIQRAVTIFLRNFLSHSTEKLQRGTLLGCVSENFQ